MKHFNRPILLLLSVVAWAAISRTGDVAAGVPNAADMKLTEEIDITTVKGELTALQEPVSKTVILVFHQPGQSKLIDRVFLGTPTQLFEQKLDSSGIMFPEDDSWDVHLFAPRAREQNSSQALLNFRGSKYRLWCSDTPDVLTVVAAPDVQAILKSARFRTSGAVHRPVALARDDAGIYYYVDRLRDDLGGEGYRVYVGKRGALKQMPLRDVATDSAGKVFATKKGELQLTIDTGAASGAAWKSKGKSRTLKMLSLFKESYLIHRELGVYSAFGAACDEQ